MGDTSLISVDLKPMADVTNNIINKFSQAIGWAMVPRKSKKEMEIAVEIYIKEIQEDDSLPPIIRAAKICNARKEIKEYVNLQDILQHAQEFGNEYEKNEEELDEDWAMFFYDRAKNISFNDAKVLWGKILAEECNERGSIPKTLVHILSVMSKEEAESFEDICGFIVDTYSDEKYFDKGLIVPSNYQCVSELNFFKIKNLESLGLIIYSNKSLEVDNSIDNRKIDKLIYHDLKITLDYELDQLPVGHISFTRAGEILSSMIEEKKLEKFVDSLKVYFKVNGVKAEIYPL